MKCNGRIYFATHGDWWFHYARFATQEGYPGAHCMAYDPKTAQVRDFGIGPQFEGINTGAYDPQFNRIYGLTHPRGHFVYYGVTTGAKVDKGRIDNWDSICRTLGIDDYIGEDERISKLYLFYPLAVKGGMKKS